MGLRVLHVIGGGDTGGAMANVLPLVAGLRAEGVEVRLACLGEGGLAERAQARGLEPLVLPMTNPWDPGVLGPLRRLLQGDAGLGGRWPRRLGRSYWDVVHSHGMRANLPVRMLARLTWPRPCVVTTVHSDLALDYANSWQAGAYHLLDRLSRTGVDRLVAVSEGLAADLAARGWPAEKTAVVPSGVELEPWGRKGVLGVEQLPAHDGRTTVGTVARLVPVKDLELLLDVAGRLRSSVPDVRVVIVGDGPEGPGLRAEADARGLEGVVLFTGEVRPAWRALETFDAFVLTSKSEGLPVSVLEAMACALPVVATRVGGLPEVVEEGVTGFLVSREGSREETADRLADSLTLLLRDEDLRRRMGSAGARRVARSFTARSTARRMLRVYERCVLEKSSGRREG